MRPRVERCWARGGPAVPRRRLAVWQERGPAELNDVERSFSPPARSGRIAIGRRGGGGSAGIGGLAVASGDRRDRRRGADAVEERERREERGAVPPARRRRHRRRGTRSSFASSLTGVPSGADRPGRAGATTGRPCLAPARRAARPRRTRHRRAQPRRRAGGGTGRLAPRLGRGDRPDGARALSLGRWGGTCWGGVAVTRPGTSPEDRTARSCSGRTALRRARWGTLGAPVWDVTLLRAAARSGGGGFGRLALGDRRRARSRVERARTVSVGETPGVVRQPKLRLRSETATRDGGPDGSAGPRDASSR